MRRTPRITPSLEELSVRGLIIRIRWERAKRKGLHEGSPEALRVGIAEARLIRELHHRFGVENIAAHDLEWYLRSDRSDAMDRERVAAASRQGAS